MKVIEACVPSKKVTCPVCKSKLECDIDDVILRLDGGDGTRPQQIQCPICMSYINLTGTARFPDALIKMREDEVLY
jgi:hypothetical protein